MKEHEKSRVWLFGDNVNTDLMSPGYTWNMEWSEAKKHILVNHPRFAPEVREGDIIVAGDNFDRGATGDAAQGVVAEAAAVMVARHDAAELADHRLPVDLPRKLAVSTVSVDLLSKQHCAGASSDCFQGCGIHLEGRRSGQSGH